MNSSDAIDDLVARFVADILEIIEQARGERRAEALAAVQSMLANVHPRAAKPGLPSPRLKATPARRASRRPAARRPPVGHAPLAHPAPVPVAARAPRAVVSSRATARRVAPVPIATSAPGPSAPAGAPPTPGSAEQDNTARETQVLGAIRSVVRATVGEIATLTGLPNGTVYVVLRPLLAAGRVAKTASARGVEYSLPSNGSIQPFKRRRAGVPGKEEAGGPAEGDGRGAEWAGAPSPPGGERQDARGATSAEAAASPPTPPAT